MKLFSGFAWLISGRIISAVLQAITLLLTARVAGPSQFGILATYMGLIIVVQTVLDFGISTYITKIRASTPNSILVNYLLRVYSHLGLLMITVLISSAIAMSLLAGMPWWSLLPLTIAGSAERQANVRLNVALADGDVWKNTINLTVRRLLSLLALCLLVYVGVNAVLSFGISAAFGALVTLYLSRKLVRLRSVTPRLSWRRHCIFMSASYAYWLNSVGAQLRNLDVLAVSILAGTAITGQYGAISRAIGPLRMVSASFSAVLLPLAVKQKKDTGGGLFWSVIILVCGNAILYIVLAFFSHEVVYFLLGSEYLPSASALSIVLLGLIPATISSSMTPILQARGFAVGVGRIAMTSSLLALVAVGVGARILGIDGAALGLSFSYVIQLLLLAVFAIAVRSSEGAKYD